MLRSLRVFFGISLALVLAPGCKSEEGFTESPADVSGDYTMGLTNGENGCAFDNWVEGNTTQDVGFHVTQSGQDLNASVDLGAAIYLGLFIGKAEFEGSVTGSDFTVVAYGTISRRQGNCSYTLNATVDGTLAGDAISGTISYSPATNDNPDCAALQCSSIQDFSGSRPPK